MDRYNTPSEKRWLENTLYDIMKIKTSKTSVYKSISLLGIAEDTAYLECEPYDDAYSVEKANSVLHRRKKAIMDKLGVNHLNVTYFDSWAVSHGEIIHRT